MDILLLGYLMGYFTNQAGVKEIEEPEDNNSNNLDPDDPFYYDKLHAMNEEENFNY